MEHSIISKPPVYPLTQQEKLNPCIPGREKPSDLSTVNFLPHHKEHLRISPTLSLRLHAHLMPISFPSFSAAPSIVLNSFPFAWFHHWR